MEWHTPEWHWQHSQWGKDRKLALVTILLSDFEHRWHWSLLSSSKPLVLAIAVVVCQIDTLILLYTNLMSCYVSLTFFSHFVPWYVHRLNSSVHLLRRRKLHQICAWLLILRKRQVSQFVELKVINLLVKFTYLPHYIKRALCIGLHCRKCSICFASFWLLSLCFASRPFVTVFFVSSLSSACSQSGP